MLYYNWCVSLHIALMLALTLMVSLIYVRLRNTDSKACLSDSGGWLDTRMVDTAHAIVPLMRILRLVSQFLFDGCRGSRFSKYVVRTTITRCPERTVLNLVWFIRYGCTSKGLQLGSTLPKTPLTHRARNSWYFGSKCYHVFSFATGILMW